MYIFENRELADYTGDILLKKIEDSYVRNFLLHQRQRSERFGNLSDATVHNYYAVIRTFSRWLRDQEYMQNSATRKVRAP